MNNKRQDKIIELLEANNTFSSKEIYNIIKNEEETSLITIKRDVKSLSVLGFIEIFGGNRNRKYKLSTKGALLYPIDTKKYCSVDIDKRNCLDTFNFNLFLKIKDIDLFSPEELTLLENATSKYHSRNKDLSETIKKRELERFIIELSWKSSKIEGNTYTLLDTERLIKEGIQNNEKSQSDANMIINHKKAFDFSLLNIDFFKYLSISTVESLHSKIIENLGVNRNIRKNRVGITGTKYIPLENEYQIREALEELLKLINFKNNPYEKALLSVLCFSYIQPFEDGNKRTSRILGNAILINHKLAPLSYRSTDENDYKEAMLVFYEKNNITSFKKIFIEQYLFSCENYGIY